MCCYDSIVWVRLTGVTGVTGHKQDKEYLHDMFLLFVFSPNNGC